MNFRTSIKQVLARIYCSKKKKDLKVIINFKKELIPFLSEIRDGGVIYKFVVKKKKIEISLKKNKNRPKFNHNHKKIRSFDISEALYKDPSLLIFVSTAQGIRTNCCFKGQPKKAGGIQLFLTN